LTEKEVGDVIIALIVIGIKTYAFIGGVFGWLFYKSNIKRCKYCSEGYRCMDAHRLVAGLTAAVWPVALPVCAGGMVANHLTTRNEAKTSRDDRAHKRRLEELESERKLVAEQKQRTLADIKFLVENGIQAAVPGLHEEN
jgi:hypothetical protein